MREGAGPGVNVPLHKGSTGEACIFNLQDMLCVLFPSRFPTAIHEPGVLRNSNFPPLAAAARHHCPAAAGGGGGRPQPQFTVVCFQRLTAESAGRTP
eukprot:gene15561-biopygen3695